MGALLAGCHALLPFATALEATPLTEWTIFCVNSSAYVSGTPCVTMALFIARLHRQAPQRNAIPSQTIIASTPIVPARSRAAIHIASITANGHTSRGADRACFQSGSGGTLRPCVQGSRLKDYSSPSSSDFLLSVEMASAKRWNCLRKASVSS